MKKIVIVLLLASTIYGGCTAFSKAKEQVTSSTSSFAARSEMLR